MGLTGRARANGGARRPADVSKEVLFGVVGELVSFADRESGIHIDVSIGAQGVPDPADPQVTHSIDTFDGVDRGGGLIDIGLLVGYSVSKRPASERSN